MDKIIKTMKNNMKFLFLRGKFKSIHNSGRSIDGKYKEQCMWMSFEWFIINILGITDMTFIAIRELLLSCSFTINGEKEQFDYSLHNEALNFICEHFKLTLIICQTNEENEIDVSNSMKFGEGVLDDGFVCNDRVLYIVYNGGHFEPIYQIGFHMLYDVDIATLQLSKPKNISKQLNVEKEVYSEIDDFNSTESIISKLEKNKIYIVEKINELNQRLLQIKETNPQEIEFQVNIIYELFLFLYY